MIHYEWQLGAVFAYYPLLLAGLVATLELAGVSFVAGLAIGLVMGVGRLARNPLLRFPATAFIEIFQNTPALIQLFWFFYVVPILTGRQQDVFLSSAVALSCNAGAYLGEIFRGGIQSIGHGQWDAARAIGIRPHLILRHVILPQAIKRMIPAFTNRGIELVKMTSLASSLAYGELLYQASLISTDLYRPIETYTVVAFIYVGLLSVFSFCTARLERRLRKSD
jgi:polar amino acid transport system permease protein